MSSLAAVVNRSAVGAEDGPSGISICSDIRPSEDGHRAQPQPFRSRSTRQFDGIPSKKMSSAGTVVAPGAELTGLWRTSGRRRRSELAESAVEAGRKRRLHRSLGEEQLTAVATAYADVAPVPGL